MRARFHVLGILILFSAITTRTNCQYYSEWRQRSSNFKRVWEFKFVNYINVILKENITEERRIFYEYALYMGGSYGYCSCDDACTTDEVFDAYAALGRLHTLRSYNPIHYLKLCDNYDSYRNYGICKCTDVYHTTYHSVLPLESQQPQKTAMSRYYPPLGLIQCAHTNFELVKNMPEPYWKKAIPEPVNTGKNLLCSWI